LRRTFSGLPSPGRPTGGVPVQTAFPSRTVSAAGLRTPMNDQRVQEAPFSADSNRNVPGRSAASLRYTPIGVSPSARTRRTTGITRRLSARARKSSRDGLTEPGPDEPAEALTMGSL